MILVDTNILVFLVLDGPQTEAARALLELDFDWRSESYTLIELSNVLATVMRMRNLSLAKAQAVFAATRTLIEPGLVTVEHRDAIALARRYNTSAYDARFLLAARYFGVKLVTEDRKVRSAAPALTLSLEQALVF